MNLRLYSISDTYCNYLRKFDNKVYDNKEITRNHTRKYLGIALTINSINYFIPMSSPKPTDYLDNSFKIPRKSIPTIIRMTDIRKPNKLYGTLRISNMIPTPIEEIEPYDIQKEKDINYKNVILSELSFISRNQDKIIKYASKVYFQKNSNKNIPYLNNCVNFKLLENKCKEYINLKN